MQSLPKVCEFWCVQYNFICSSDTCIWLVVFSSYKTMLWYSWNNVFTPLSIFLNHSSYLKKWSCFVSNWDRWQSIFVDWQKLRSLTFKFMMLIPANDLSCYLCLSLCIKFCENWLSPISVSANPRKLTTTKINEPTVL
jgi:hypothetical protein